MRNVSDELLRKSKYTFCVQQLPPPLTELIALLAIFEKILYVELTDKKL